VQWHLLLAQLAALLPFVSSASLPQLDEQEQPRHTSEEPRTGRLKKATLAESDFMVSNAHHH